MRSNTKEDKLPFRAKDLGRVSCCHVLTKSWSSFVSAPGHPEILGTHPTARRHRAELYCTPEIMFTRLLASALLALTWTAHAFEVDPETLPRVVDSVGPLLTKLWT